MEYDRYFDASNPDTPPRMKPAVTLDDAPGGVPMSGTGLAGAAYAPGGSINSIEQLEDIMSRIDPQATFTATEIDYGSRDSETTISEFLDHDSGSVTGNGDLEMGPSGLALTGFIYIPEGVHEIEVISDDGFSLELGGVDFMEFEGRRGSDSTSRVSEFEGGLYRVELLYFDGGGGMDLDLYIDGLPVQSSALFGSIDEFTNPPEGTTIVPIDDYHPSHFVGAAYFDGNDQINGTQTVDVIDAEGGDDVVNGYAGDDHLLGNYGDDYLLGGADDDVIDGGRGSDYAHGGAGNDLLVVRSDSGEQRIGQLAVGMPTRDDPDGEVNEERQKLYGYEDQPLHADDILIGGSGQDTFLITSLLNGKLDIIEKHVRSDGSINWAGVAGENDELHDHWTDSFGMVVIADYNANEDQIAVIGHTANIYVQHIDLDGDGVDDTLIDVISNQHGGGGAHAMDLIGQIMVFGDLVYEDDIQTDAGVTYGIVEEISDVAEALVPEGDVKISEDGVYGYDTRDENGGWGSVSGDPFNNFDNPYEDQMELAGRSDPVMSETRGFFDQLEVIEAPKRLREGNASDNRMYAGQSSQAEEGMPGAVGYWSFADDGTGSFADARGNSTAKAYTLWENQALLRTDGVSTDGPLPGVTALEFNGEDQFAFIESHQNHQVTQGTIALWVRPDDLSSKGMFVSKDERNTGDGGHFRLGHTAEGGLLLRMAPGDGDSGNVTWESEPGLLTEGAWQHLAVSFTEDGVTVYIDGEAVDPSVWTPVEGDVESPDVYTEYFMLMNQEPWVLGADQSRTERNDTAQQFAIDDEDLESPLDGAIAEFGIWGGTEPTDALTQDEIQTLITDGPGTALTNPSGPQPIIARNDKMKGYQGDDDMDGGAGNDRMTGGTGNDEMKGGYGNDILWGSWGDDIIEGGHGSDLMLGGKGNDTLISASHSGEQRIGQLVIDDPSREAEPGTIDYQYLKLQDWVDQPLINDDVLIGGEGNDHFYFETRINAKLDIIMEHVNEDRTINWHGVAGENKYLHDHWVDSLGIQIIGDYNAEEDTISVVGHTTNVRVDYLAIDSDGDGFDDSMVSIIEVYSQQGNGGGAHDEDNLGWIVVHGDKVEEEDIITDAGAHYGVVDTIDELQEAMAPNGQTKWSEMPDGTAHLGYDSRDVEGDPIGSDPESFSDNPFMKLASSLFEDETIADSDPIAAVNQFDGNTTFDGTNYETMAHDAAEQQTSGTWVFAFNADEVGDEPMTLVSKDHSGMKAGGHLSIWVGTDGQIRARFQTLNQSKELRSDDVRVEEGEDMTVAFTFDSSGASLFVDGNLVDTEEFSNDGMMGNYEDTLIGASSKTRQGDEDNAEEFFQGEIWNVSVLDRAITEFEAVILDGYGNDFDAMLDSLTAPDPEPETDDGTLDMPMPEMEIPMAETSQFDTLLV
ncbi:MAG: LamG-like jellyroll fold domain-containing protein [Pseudomonadota bacterium]